MKCEEVDKIISDYSVGNLPARARAQVRQHLESCESCAKELKRIEMMVSTIEEVPLIDPPLGLWNGVYNRITAEPAARPSIIDRLFVARRRTLSIGLGVVALASAVVFGISTQQSHRMAASPEPGTVEYVQGHIYAASNDVFADRVGLGFVAAMPAPKDEITQ